MPIKIVQLRILLILHFVILCGCVLICVTSVESTMHALYFSKIMGFKCPQNYTVGYEACRSERLRTNFDPWGS